MNENKKNEKPCLGNFTETLEAGSPPKKKEDEPLPTGMDSAVHFEEDDPEELFPDDEKKNPQKRQP